MNTKQALHKVRILIGQTPNHDHSIITDPTTFADSLNSFYMIRHSWPLCCLWGSVQCPPPWTNQHPSLHCGGRTEAAKQVQSWQSTRAWWHPSWGAEAICHEVIPHPPFHPLGLLQISIYSHNLENICHYPGTQETPPLLAKPLSTSYTHLNFMKCLEKLILHTVLPAVRPYQFAYRARRGTEDAVACLLLPLLQHLESPDTFASILFIDFSSAFNMIQHRQMIKKLLHLNISPPLIHRVHHLFSNRPQTVRRGTVTSQTIITDTGAPQGCVLSPFLYTLYTNDCDSPSPITTYYKYSDDTAILVLLSNNNSITAYRP